jgi:acetyl esterase/lipase
MQPSRRLVIAGLVGTALSGCSPLKVLNNIVPKDAASEQVAKDVSYGPDKRQRLDIYRPDHLPGNLPVVIFVYGGSWSSGSKDDYSFVGRALSARGFLTIVCDYRLVPAVHFPAFVEDCASVVRWAHDNAASYGGEVRQLHLVGHSAGAYNAVMVALDSQFLAKVGLPIRTIASVTGLSGPYDFLPLDVDVAIAAFSQAPNLARTQPVNLANAQAPPMFLATGDRDTTVYPKNTYHLATKLRRAGANVVEKTYPGLDHADTVLALSTAFRSKAPVLDDVARFISSDLLRGRLPR